jgi:AraC-like DNA-binding protein
MLFETTSLASSVALLIEAVEKHYGFDPRPLLEARGVDLSRLNIPGARMSDAALDAALEDLIERTGDPCMGLAVGGQIRPTSIHALGYAWLASGTLLDAFQRLARFDRTVSTSDHIEVSLQGETCELRVASRVPGYMQPPLAIDAYFTAVLRLCRLVKDQHFAPLQVRLIHSSFERASDYVAAFQAPVVFDADADVMVFDAAAVMEPLVGANPELAALNDRVAEAYLESLDPEMVASKVRDLLVSMLPSGQASQDAVAGKLARSTSALQRQLRSEGTSFQQLRDETRRELALGYLREGRLSLTEIAFLVGFTDQSNFSRAFRRWTGVSPGEWKGSQSKELA